MTVMEDLERREKELKAALEVADSLDERKSLRLELREVRRQLFETPATVKKEPEVLAKRQNQNIDENNNISNEMTKTSNLITNKSFETSKDSNVSSVRADRAARRARRAEHMKNLANESKSSDKAENSNTMNSINNIEKIKNDEISNAESSKPVMKTSNGITIRSQSKIVDEKENDNKIDTGKRTSTGITIKTQLSSKEKTLEEDKPRESEENKVTSKVALRNREFTSNETGLRRTATWSTSNRGTASRGNAFSSNKAKFGAQAGTSPFSFGISYGSKKTENTTSEHPITRPYSSSINTHTNTSSNLNQSNRSPLLPPRQTHFKIAEEKVFPKRKESFNKYQTEITNQKNLDNEVHDKSSTNTEVGLNFTPKTNKFKSSSELLQNNKYMIPQQSASFNKYNASSVIKPENSHTGLRRVFSENPTNTSSNKLSEKDNINSRTRSESSFSRLTNRFNNMNVNETNNLKKTVSNAEKVIPTSQAKNISASIISRSIIARAASSPNRDQSSDSRPKSMFSEQSSNLQPDGRPMSMSGDKSPSSRPGSWVNDRSPNTARRGNTRPTSFKPEVEAPAFSSGSGGGPMSAADRMAMFRQAEEKAKKDEERKKAREEERKKQAEEAARQKAEAEKKKKEEEEQRKRDEVQKKEQKPEIKDSEKMKFAAPCMKKREKKKVTRRTMSISSIVLDWVQEMIKDYPVEVKNFSSSWNNGMAFCALIHHFNPDEFDFNELKPENKRHNFDLAFNTGLKVKDIPILLDTEDMVRMPKPEPRSVQTYIQWIWSVYGPTSGYGPTPKEVQSASLS